MNGDLQNYQIASIASNLFADISAAITDQLKKICWLQMGSFKWTTQR